MHISRVTWGSQGSISQMICPGGISNRNGKITAITRILSISNCCKYSSHSTSTFHVQQVPFSGLYFDEQVPSLQIRITIIFSTGLQTPHTSFPGFPATLSVFRFYTLFRSCITASIDENWTLIERRVRHLERTVPGRYLLSYCTVTFSLHRWMNQPNLKE